MPGHNIDSIDFKQPELLSKYTCPECHLLLSDAVQPSCGHWLCLSCADTIIARQKNPCCPKKDCGEPFTPEDDEAKLYFPDRFVRKDVLGLSISCKFHLMGCKWEGKFSELKEHLKRCDYNKLELSHTSKLLQKCPLSKIGCDGTQMSAQQLEEHLEFKKIQHMEMMAERISDLEAYVYSAKRSDPDGKCDSGFDSLGGHLDIVEADCATTHSNDRIVKKSAPKLVTRDTTSEYNSARMFDRRIMTIFDEEVSKLRGELKSGVASELKAKNDEIEGLKSTIVKLEKNMRSRNADFEDRDFRLSLIENSNYDGTMVWKIPQFSQRMSDAQSGKYTSIFSLPFYTGRYGYKMCLRLYILGDGIGKGNYMSLFFVLMKGEFDNILQWPFTHKVTFKLINQGNGRDVVDTFQPDPMSSSFRKPKSDMNIASGCPRFVSHSDLKSGGYILEDTVFIKCTIDTSTIKHP